MNGKIDASKQTIQRIVGQARSPISKRMQIWVDK